MVIDRIELFKEKQIAAMYDQALIREFKEKYNIVLVELPEKGADIIIDGRMYAFLPEKE